MGIRIYLCPIVGDGVSTATAYRPQLAGMTGVSLSATIPHNPDGTPKFNFALCVARNVDWTACDAVSALERLFDIDLPDTIDTWPELKAFLQSKTVGDIPPLRRQALNTRLTNHGFDTSQVTLATTWWQVLRGMLTQMVGAPIGDGIGIV